MKLFLKIFFFFFTILCVFAGETIQGYKVKGSLLCGNKPAADVQVKLIDDDFGPDADDVLDESFTNADGSFHLNGQTKERTTIDPHLKIYHDCNDGLKPCQRRLKLELPHHYIIKGGSAGNVLDIGEWNLESLFPGEARDCSH